MTADERTLLVLGMLLHLPDRYGHLHRRRALPVASKRVISAMYEYEFSFLMIVRHRLKKWKHPWELFKDLVTRERATMVIHDMESEERVDGVIPEGQGELVVLALQELHEEEVVVPEDGDVLLVDMVFDGCQDFSRVRSTVYIVAEEDEPIILFILLDGL